MRLLAGLGVLLALGAGCRPAVPSTGPLLDAERRRAARAARVTVAGFERDLPSLLSRQLRDSASASLAAALAKTLRSGGYLPKNLEILRVIYRAEGARLRFARLEGLTAAGEALRTNLAAAGAHGLDPRAYHTTRVDRLQRTHARMLEQATSRPAPTLDPTERARLEEAVLRLGPEAGHRSLVAMVLGGASPLPRLAVQFSEAERSQRKLARVTAQLELTLADGLLRLARDLGRGKGAPGRERAMLQQDLSSVTDLASLAELLAKLPPPNPQYRRLQGALARYRRIVESGGWPPLPPYRDRKGLRPGRRHPLVEPLKRRLAAEGHYDGSIDRVFDHDLSNAIRRYRELHRLKISGRADRELWQSLDRPAGHQLQLIELALERWRQSAVGRVSSTYLLVNVPDFHLEVFRGEKLIQRQKVVVGKALPYKCDEETQQEVLAFATPTQSSQVKLMVFSPYWNVTREIKETELDPERAKDPRFYEKHGYEIMQPGTKGEWIRQLPGPANPLGFVKFIFRSPHETYLHDTPLKGLFARQRRAFSHGCVRVEKAWDLAKLLLSIDGQWDEQQYKVLHRRWEKMVFLPLQTEWDEELYDRLKKRAEKLETTVNLNKPVPIHIVYVTARVDDEGRVSFLPDIYRLDEQRLRPSPPRPCIPETKQAKRGFTATLNRVKSLERQVLGLAPCLLLADLLKRSTAGSVGGTGQGESARKHARLRRLLRKLDNFYRHHSNLAQSIRDKHEALEEALERHRRRWNDRLVARAVRLNRLLTALDVMTRKAQGICTALNKLAPGSFTEEPEPR